MVKRNKKGAIAFFSQCYKRFFSVTHSRNEISSVRDACPIMAKECGIKEKKPEMVDEENIKERVLLERKESGY